MNIGMPQQGFQADNNGADGERIGERTIAKGTRRKLAPFAQKE